MQHPEISRIIGMPEAGLSYRPIGQSLIVWDEMWPLCYGVVVPGLKTSVTETFTVFLSYGPIIVHFSSLKKDTRTFYLCHCH
jgi:hypothetical protein